jgi:hypothetical protein
MGAPAVARARRPNPASGEALGRASLPGPAVGRGSLPGPAVGRASLPGPATGRPAVGRASLPVPAVGRASPADSVTSRPVAWASLPAPVVGQASRPPPAIGRPVRRRSPPAPAGGPGASHRDRQARVSGRRRRRLRVAGVTGLEQVRPQTGLVGERTRAVREDSDPLTRLAGRSRRVPAADIPPTAAQEGREPARRRQALGGVAPGRRLIAVGEPRRAPATSAGLRASLPTARLRPGYRRR